MGSEIIFYPLLPQGGSGGFSSSKVSCLYIAMLVHRPGSWDTHGTLIRLGHTSPMGLSCSIATSCAFFPSFCLRFLNIPNPFRPIHNFKASFVNESSAFTRPKKWLLIIFMVHFYGFSPLCNVIIDPSLQQQKVADFCHLEKRSRRGLKSATTFQNFF